MGSEQQFCLRWNNHQSTLVAVFDTLLESGTLVDCTLAAEGQYLKAHKVVLSACSPYFELLLSQHYEKHPIVILKDVKFQELKAMMDYMYRGEVNISQDQLGALLKAAESLQIKGLSDSGGGNDRESSEKRHGRKESVAPQPPPARTPPLLPPHSSGLTIEHRRSAQQTAPPVVELPEDSPPPPHSRMSGSREGSISPIPRKRKKHRRRSSTGEEGSQGLLPMTDSHDQTSSSCELPPQSQPPPVSNIPAVISPVVPSPSSVNKPTSDPIATGPEEQTEPEMTGSSLPPSQPNISSVAEVLPPDLEAIQKMEPTSEPLLEPKSEYVEETMNEDSVEDLTLDDMDDLNQAKPGPSHGGESSNQGTGFAPWHVTAAERSTDEVFMAAQEAVGAHRDSQDAVRGRGRPRGRGRGRGRRRGFGSVRGRWRGRGNSRGSMNGLSQGLSLVRSSGRPRGRPSCRKRGPGRPPYSSSGFQSVSTRQVVSNTASLSVNSDVRDLVGQRRVEQHPSGTIILTRSFSLPRGRGRGRSRGRGPRVRGGSLVRSGRLRLASSYPCANGCGRQYALRGTMAHHMITECENRDRMQVDGLLPCARCGKTFESNRNLLRHARFDCGRSLQPNRLPGEADESSDTDTANEVDDAPVICNGTPNVDHDANNDPVVNSDICFSDALTPLSNGGDTIVIKKEVVEKPEAPPYVAARKSGGRRKFKCSSCPFRTKYWGFLRRHIRERHTAAV